MAAKRVPAGRRLWRDEKRVPGADGSCVRDSQGRSGRGRRASDSQTANSYSCRVDGPAVHLLPFGERHSCRPIQKAASPKSQRRVESQRVRRLGRPPAKSTPRPSPTTPEKANIATIAKFANFDDRSKFVTAHVCVLHPEAGVTSSGRRMGRIARCHCRWRRRGGWFVRISNTDRSDRTCTHCF